MLASPYTVDEAERNIQRYNPDALDEFHKVSEHPSVGLEPSEGLVVGLNAQLPERGTVARQRLAGVGRSNCRGRRPACYPRRRALRPLYGRTVQGVEVMRPGTALWKLLRRARRR